MFKANNGSQRLTRAVFFDRFQRTRYLNIYNESRWFNELMNISTTFHPFGCWRAKETQNYPRRSAREQICQARALRPLPRLILSTSWTNEGRPRTARSRQKLSRLKVNKVKKGRCKITLLNYLSSHPLRNAIRRASNLFRAISSPDPRRNIDCLSVCRVARAESRIIPSG